MSDYLKELCSKANIELIFTNNKYKAASIGIHDNIPKLRLHNLFKGCPRDIADAIISFYVKFENIDISQEIIEDYLLNNYPLDNFYLTPPDENIKLFFTNQITSSIPNDIENKALRELDILSISKIDMKGNYSEIGVEDSMSIDEGDLLEVNITINEFV